MASKNHWKKEKMNKIMLYIINRSQEPSTWRGLIITASVLGAKISPEIASAIISNGLLIAGIVGAVTKG